MWWNGFMINFHHPPLHTLTCFFLLFFVLKFFYLVQYTTQLLLLVPVPAPGIIPVPEPHSSSKNWEHFYYQFFETLTDRGVSRVNYEVPRLSKLQEDA